MKKDKLQSICFHEWNRIWRNGVAFKWCWKCGLEVKTEKSWTTEIKNWMVK